MLKHIIASRRGSAATEFTLLMPVLAVFLLGTFDMGLAFEQYSRLTSALRGAFSYIMKNKSSDLNIIQNMVRANSPNAAVVTVETCTCGGVAVTCNQICNTGFSRYISVRASDQYTPIIQWPFLPYAAGKPYITLNSAIELKVQ